jgi:hypothetical protein
MKSARTTSFICCAVWLATQFAIRAQDGFTDEAEITRFLHDHFNGTNTCMIIGLVDGQGSQIFSAGKPDGGRDASADGDTVFEIGSITKTFTALLLLDMVGHGEMKLDDPVAMYLGKSVKVPAHGNKEITLLNLAAQDSGLPFNGDNLAADDWVEAYNAFTPTELYSFLSRYVLTNGWPLEVGPGSSQSFAERSDNAELRNEKGGESLVLFKERPASRRYAALQKIAEALWHVMAGSCDYDPTSTFAELAHKKAATGRLNQLGHHLGFSKVWDRKMMHVGSWTTSLTVKEDWNEP